MKFEEALDLTRRWSRGENIQFPAESLVFPTKKLIRNIMESENYRPGGSRVSRIMWMSSSKEFIKRKKKSHAL